MVKFSVKIKSFYFCCANKMYDSEKNSMFIFSSGVKGGVRNKLKIMQIELYNSNIFEFIIIL